MAWLTGWNRRKSKIINGSTAGAQVNYQMQLIVHKGSGVDTTTDIYLGTNIRNDFGDVRFTSSDGSTLLNYWIESYTSGVSAIVWIQIDSIPASPSSSTIYIYYDSPLQTSISNGNNAFEFFDDFDDNNFDGWEPCYPVDGRCSGNVFSASNGYLEDTVGSGDIGHVTTYIDRTHTAWEWKAKQISNGEMITRFWHDGNNLNAGGALVLWDIPANNKPRLNDGSNNIIADSLYNDGLWHKFTITRSGTIWQFFVDNTFIGSSTNDLTSASTYWVFQSNTGRQAYDDVRIRKYTSPEPTFGLSSAEEFNITAIAMTLSTNTCAGPCSITANVTWQNLGTSSTTFRPAILINGITIVNADTDITITTGGTGSSVITTPTLLVGTHSICPYPN